MRTKLSAGSLPLFFMYVLFDFDLFMYANNIFFE